MITLERPQTIEEKLVTGEELLAMGDIGPTELIDGRIVPMSPTAKKHGALENRIAHQLNQFVYPRELGEVLVGEVGIYIERNPDRVRAADVIYVSRERYEQDETEGYLGVAPDLVVEIISPTDRWEQVREKIDDYFSIGVDQVWLCEPERQDFLVFDSPTTSKRFTQEQAISGKGTLEGFVLDIKRVFDPK